MTSFTLGYLILLVLWAPLIITLIKLKGIFRAPIFSISVISIFTFNILGSIVVFDETLNLYGINGLYTSQFLNIHVLQILMFYPYLYVISRASMFNFDTSLPVLPARFFVLSIGFIILTLIVFSNVTQNAPIFKLGNIGSNSLMMDARRGFFDLKFEYLWVYKIAIYLLPQLLTIIYFQKYLSRRNIYNFFIFVSIFFISAAFSIFFLHKTHLLILILSVALTKSFYYMNFNLKYLLITCLSLFLFLTLMYLAYFYSSWQQRGNEYITFFFLQIVNRLFGVYPISTAQAIVLANDLGFWNGNANSLSYFFNDGVSTKILAKEIHFQLFGYPGNAPASSIGYAYVDYGYLGVLILNMMIMSYSFIIDELIKIIKRQEIRIAFLVYFSLNSIYVSMTSFSDVYTSVYQLSIYIGLISLLFLTTVRLTNASISKRY